MSAGDRNLNIMLVVADTARADILLTASRTYYRFVTADTLDSGETAPIPSFPSAIEEIASSLSLRDGEQPLDPDIYVRISLDDRALPPTSEQGLRRLIDLLTPIAPEFTFLHGFL